MKTTLKISLSLLLVIILAGTNATFAQGKKEKVKKEMSNDEEKEIVIEKNFQGQHMRHEKKQGLLGIPGLSDEQKQKIEKMKFAHKKDLLPLKNKLNEKKAQLKTLETSDNADLQAINKVIDEMAVVKADIQKKNAAHKQEIRKLLNDEQRFIFDTRGGKKNKKQKKFKKVIKYHGGNCGDEDIMINRKFRNHSEDIDD